MQDSTGRGAHSSVAQAGNVDCLLEYSMQQIDCVVTNDGPRILECAMCNSITPSHCTVRDATMTARVPCTEAADRSWTPSVPSAVLWP